jgi:hypothetical protein
MRPDSYCARSSSSRLIIEISGTSSGPPNIV